MSLNLFECRALAATVEFLDANGYQSEPLLSRLGIPAEMMKQGGWVTINQFYEFAALSAQRVGFREAVLEAELDFFRLDHLGVISAAMRSCKTVKESLDLATGMACRGYQGCHYFLDVRGETTWLSFSNPRLAPSADKFVDDITLGAYVHLMRSVIDEDWQPQQLRIQERKADRHRSMSVFQDCKIDFDPVASGLAFPTKFLSRWVPWAEQAVSFEKPNAWERLPEEDESFSDTLYRLLASVFRYDQIPNQDRTAKMIGVSPATLKRRLASTGITYRHLVDRLRLDAACEMLSIPQMSVKEIASELGYSGTNNFVRSFRRMTGVAPGQYRWQQLVDDE